MKSFNYTVKSYLPVIGILALFLIIIYRRAWLCDDAYITFRTVDNFIHGFGLTWNVGERVQSFTHPLWMLLVSFFYFFTHEAFYTGIFLSLAVSLAAVVLFALKIAPSRLAACLGVVVLAFSNAFVDYSTSGLENPLTHLLLAIFLFLYLRRQPSPRTLFYLSLTAALAAVNRLDIMLVCLPVLAVAFWQVKEKRKAVLALLPGLLPLLLWELFSLLYYGFPFPNTAYAKLNTGVPAGTLIPQGLTYLLESLRNDPITLVAILCGLATSILSRERTRALPLVAGVLLYLLYIVRIGGDFMSGRFLAAPLLVGVSLLALNPIFQSSSRRAWVAFGLASLLGLVAVVPTFGLLPARYKPLIDDNGIADERLYYIDMAGLLNKPAGVEFPRGDWVDEGRQMRAMSELTGFQVKVTDSIGFRGYFAGPNVYIVDELGLADPLLARLPPRKDKPWRIGHFYHSLPPGYLETLETGQAQFADPNLGEFYAHLSRITRGKLLDPIRLLDIWNMNTGKYNGLIKGG